MSVLVYEMNKVVVAMAEIVALVFIAGVLGYSAMKVPADVRRSYASDSKAVAWQGRANPNEFEFFGWRGREPVKSNQGLLYDHPLYRSELSDTTRI